MRYINLPHIKNYIKVGSRNAETKIIISKSRSKIFKTLNFIRSIRKSLDFGFIKNHAHANQILKDVETHDLHTHHPKVFSMYNAKRGGKLASLTKTATN